ncbi:hypothetical protein [Aquabacter spiritensis]|uniref:Chlorite dismutase n=1 Tax=Aquabacter spiritensis TaxID=933073 RepID=A0A4R3LZK0_9HYPH|nr:hypothetical protein [Aquabacter spiritensis]TCT06112.1 hypothetical protein EDC64_103216 [Aquabacter spiritensis]
MSETRSSDATGLLIVFVDPPNREEDELHLWYDVEHLPERAAVEGFLSVQRYVCLEGWPRYMALYDLTALDVLDSPAYRAIAGANFSPWSKRIIPLVRGWTRAEAEQIHPGKAATGAAGPALRVAVVRVRGLDAEHLDRLADAFDPMFRDMRGLLQYRLFAAKAGGEPGDVYAVAEFAHPVALGDLDWTRLKLPSGAVDVANLYTRYWRKED